MNRRKYMAVLLSICVCMSVTACGRNRENIYDKYAGVTEGEGSVKESVIGQGEENSDENELNYDTVGGGVSVFVAQNSEEERDVWYPNVDVFLDAYGFWNCEPFYEYTDVNGRPVMKLYYNTETRKGCGVRYYSYPTETFPESDGIFGFVFQDAEFGEWTGYSVSDYRSLTSVYGSNGSQAVKEYTEDIEYDEKDRITQFEAKGIVPELEELGVRQAETILSMEFDYHENGSLKSRDYSHNNYVFPTSLSTLKTYFDERERVVYESGYISHGSLEYFYIYEDYNRVPQYCLTLDFMNESWMPVFVEYIVEEDETGEVTNEIQFN